MYMYIYKVYTYTVTYKTFRAKRSEFYCGRDDDNKAISLSTAIINE